VTTAPKNWAWGTHREATADHATPMGVPWWFTFSSLQSALARDKPQEALDTNRDGWTTSVAWSLEPLSAQRCK
jgi:hypothetical protein